MSTMLAIAGFEFRNRLRLISTYVYFLLYGALAAFWMAAAGGAIPDATVSFSSDKIFINSPDALALTITALGFLGVTVMAAASGRAVQQDFEYGTWHFFFTAPIRKRDYFFGRFLGAWLSLALIFLGIVVGILVGAHWPGVDKTHVGPYSLQAFVRPYLFILLPNLLWLGGVFIVVGALARRMAPVYVGGVGVLLGYLLSVNLLHDMDNKTLSALIDPIGLMTQSITTRYWSVAEKNVEQISLTGLLLWNRAIWVGTGLAVLAVGFRRFRMDAEALSSSGRRRRPDTRAPATDAANDHGTPATATVRPGAARLDFSAATWLRALPAMAGLYLREILGSPLFLVIVGGGMIYMIASSTTADNVFGTRTWPVTWQVLESTTGFFGLFVLVVTAIYAGELVWRERETRIDEIVDATPVPTWLPFSAKLLALAAIQTLLMLAVMLSCIGIQLWFHYTHFEIGHYLHELLLLQLPDYLILAALALTIHVLVNDKYAAHGLVVAWFLVSFYLPSFGYEDRLYLYGSRPDVMYSDLNGYGHFLPAARSFQAYWGAAAVLLLLLAYRFWVRGRETHWKQRIAIARLRRSPALSAFAVAALVVFAASGAWIYYNTHILNPYISTYHNQQLQAEYEKRYKQFDFAPQPRLTAMDLAVDLFPRQHRIDLKGSYAIVNRSGKPIADLYVRIPPIAEVRSITADVPLTLADSDPELAWWHYRFAQPLRPGQTTSFSFDLGYSVKGFKNGGAAATVLDNGTFLDGASGNDIARLPHFGYSEGSELVSDRDRKKFGLAPRERARDLDDQLAQQYSFSQWITHYAATVSTAPDQIAITSGELKKEWIEHTADGDRRYFRYESDTPQIAFPTVLSGRFAVRHDHWSNGKQDVDIEIDYQPGHEFDLDRMIAGVKDSLSYYTANFSPYQFGNLRIVEFPRYQKFAESFPNTVSFSESIGFIARVDDRNPKDIDYPYFVTAHEVAHQWWGHQELPASVQGGEFLSESLAEYSALMVLKHRYGDAKMHRFLKYELDRYLFGRSTENKKEQPLMRADGQAYLHYSKGSLALYELQDGIGEDAMNQALSAFVNEWRFKGPPYPTSRDLIAELRKVTPPEKQYLIADLLENITFFNLRATEASSRPLPDGKYAVTLTASAQKLRADGLGKETEVPMNEPVDIGALDQDGNPLFIEKQIAHTGDNRFEFVVDGKPARAGIDPLNKMIDRVPSDNTVAVRAE